MSAPILLCDGFDARRTVIRKLNEDESSMVTTEEDDGAVFTGDSLLGDAVGEEWSGENRFCFYFVKQFAYDDPEIKAKIAEANNDIYHCNTDRIHIANSLKSKRAERLSLVAATEKLISSLDGYNGISPYQSVTPAMTEVNKDQKMVTGKIYSLSEMLSEIKMEIELLDVQMACVLDQRDKAVERIKILRIQRDRGVEKFMPSHDERKLRRNGKITDLEDDVDIEKGNETVGKHAIELKRFSTEEESDKCMDTDIPLYEKLGKEEEETDEETLEEKKREEQIVKARLAMERKRKLHEKAAMRAKKEGEKKLKELEKRTKKKKKRLQRLILLLWM